MTFKRKAPFAVLTVAALALTACAESDRERTLGRAPASGD